MDFSDLIRSPPPGLPGHQLSIIIFIPIKQNYQKSAEALIALREAPHKEEEMQLIHNASGEVLNALKGNHKAICEEDSEGALTRRLLSRLVSSSVPQLTALMREMLEILYSKESPLLQRAVYPAYPALLRRIIEAQEGKGTGTKLIKCRAGPTATSGTCL